MNTELFPSLKLPPGANDDQLGLGAVGSDSGHRRLLNADGAFNVHRNSGSWSQQNTLYHQALTVSWPRFAVVLTLAYLALNMLFAVLFVLNGEGSLTGPGLEMPGGNFTRSFFFSVQTFATIGYGHIAPQGMASNIIVTFEALVGVLYQSLAAGLFIARLTRPRAAIVFSKNAVVAPFNRGKGFMLRLTNTRRSELLDLEARVILSRMVLRDGAPARQYETLTLDRERVTFMPVAWMLVHPIVPDSPLWGATAESLAMQSAEVLVMTSGVDETYAQTVHARTSYQASEILFGQKFSSMFGAQSATGPLVVDVRRVSATEPVTH